jgi:predicted PurR-regulated permease PerM
MPPARRASYALVVLLLVGVVALRLGPVLLAGLFSYMVLDVTQRPMGRALPNLLSRLLALLIFLVTAVLLTWLFGHFVRLTLERAPAILASLVPQVDALASRFGIDLPFENLQEFRVVFQETLKDNARSITQASGLLTRGFFQVVVGVGVAVLVFFADPAPDQKSNLLEAIRHEFVDRVRLFMTGFEKVLGAQVIVSLVNTVITACFLLILGLPYFHFLTLATFMFGIIPVIGNVLSNMIIVSTALIVSPNLAAVSLAFLVVLHKAQYFLYSKIVGSRIKTPMWQLMLGLLIGESVMGVPGMILAAAALHYLREELRSIPVKAL